MYYNMLQYPRQITSVRFDLYTLCFFVTRWCPNKNTFNEKLALLPAFSSQLRTARKTETRNGRIVTIGSHCNGRIRVSTLRYSETFHPSGRNTFDLIFFYPFPRPSRCRRGVTSCREGGGLVCSAGIHRGEGRTRERERERGGGERGGRRRERENISIPARP